MVERIRLLLSRFSEDEETVRRMVATDSSFDALCHEYRKVIDLLDRFKVEVKRLPKVIAVSYTHLTLPTTERV